MPSAVWDAVPEMTNVVAKVTQQVSHGTWDDSAVEAFSSLVILGFERRSKHTSHSVTTGCQLRDGRTTETQVAPPVHSVVKVICIRCSAVALNEQKLLKEET